MNDNGVDMYKKLFLESSFEIIYKIKNNIKTNPDIVLLHRLFHNLKGQTLFMNLVDIGGLCLKGEKLLEQLIQKKMNLDEINKNSLILLLNKVEAALISYENTNR